MADTPQERVNEPWSHLSTLPVTNWKAVSGTFMCWMVAIFLMGLIVSFKNTDHETLITGLVDSLLMFVGVVAGVIPATMFGVKRATFQAGSPDDKRSDVVTAASAVQEGVPASSPSANPSQQVDGGDKAGTPVIDRRSQEILPLPHKEPERGED